MELVVNDNLTRDEALVWAVLEKRKGKGSAVTQAELAERTGLGTRQVRRAVQSLVEERGIMICSDYGSGGGYFVPETQEEIDIYYERLRGHALAILKRAKPFKHFNLENIQLELGLNA